MYNSNHQGDIQTNRRFQRRSTAEFTSVVFTAISPEMEAFSSITKKKATNDNEKVHDFLPKDSMDRKFLTKSDCLHDNYIPRHQINKITPSKTQDPKKNILWIPPTSTFTQTTQNAHFYPIYLNSTPNLHIQLQTRSIPPTHLHIALSNNKTPTSSKHT